MTEEETLTQMVLGVLKDEGDSVDVSSKHLAVVGLAVDGKAFADWLTAHSLRMLKLPASGRIRLTRQ